jgi:hypothetical protein
MSVKLDIFANVKGAKQVTGLNVGVKNLGKSATIAATRMKTLEAAAVKGRASFAALATTLKVGMVAGLAAVGFGISKFVKDTFAAGKLIQSLEVRFKLLFNSVDEGKKAFEEMNKFAGKVPFSLEAIAAGAGNLAVISKNADDLAKILKVTGNVAAATGLDFRQTAEQIQRSFAGGIAAADVFRERGVRAMLGFESGVTVSVEETKKRFFEVFGSGGQFSTATKEFESTLEAQVSFVEDAYFRFRQAASQPLFEGITAQVKELVGDFKANDTALKELAKTVGKGLADAFKSLGNFLKIVASNMDLLLTAFKVMVSLKLTSMFINMGVAVVSLVTGIRAATTSMGIFNAVTRANPIGLLITVIQLGVVAWIAFGDAIKNSVIKVMKNLQKTFVKFEIGFLKFISSTAKLLRFNVDSSKLEDAENRLARINRELLNLNITDEERRVSIEEISRMEKERFERKANSIKFEKEQINLIVEAEKAAAEAVKKINNDLLSNRENYAVKATQTLGIYLDEAHGVTRGFAKGVKSSMKEALDVTANYEKFGSDVFDNMTDAIAEFVQTGKLNFKSLANDFIQQIIRMETKALAAKAIQAITGGSSGGGGSIIGSIGKIFGFAKGGIVPGSAPYTDKVPAMLTPGEVVIPRDKVGSTGGSTIINNINISGNVDQRSIDQIKSVIATSSKEVGGSNRKFNRNTTRMRTRNT